MPRTARKKSSSGIYHIILRGTNRQNIFEDEEDRIKYLQTLKECKTLSGCRLFAYCLMGNHIHMLVQQGDEDLGIFMRRVGARFVYWYNRKYKRCGHLFQDRYKSESVDTDGYFLTVLRYIHQNPMKAGMVKEIAGYQWSSFHEYLNNPQITDTDYALKLFDEDRSTAMEEFERFHGGVNEDRCLEIEDNRRLTDKDASEIAVKKCKVKDAKEIQKFPFKIRDGSLRELKEEGLSTRQIERLTGISRSIILKA